MIYRIYKIQISNMKITRRDLLKQTTLASAGIIAAPMLNRGRFRLFAHTATEYSTRAIDLIGRATVIDMLAVMTLDFNKQAKWFADPESFQPADVQPYLDSGINVFHQAVGLGGPNAYESALQYVARWNGFIANYGEHFMRIDSTADLKRVKKSKRSVSCSAFRIPTIFDGRTTSISFVAWANACRSSPTTPEISSVTARRNVETKAYQTSAFPLSSV